MGGQGDGARESDSLLGAGALGNNLPPPPILASAWIARDFFEFDVVSSKIRVIMYNPESMRNKMLIQGRCFRVKYLFPFLTPVLTALFKPAQNRLANITEGNIN